MHIPKPDVIDGPEQTNNCRKICKEIQRLFHLHREDISNIREGVSGLKATVMSNEAAAQTRDATTAAELRGLRQQIRRNL